MFPRYPNHKDLEVDHDISYLDGRRSLERYSGRQPFPLGFKNPPNARITYSLVADFCSHPDPSHLDIHKPLNTVLVAHIVQESLKTQGSFTAVSRNSFHCCQLVMLSFRGLCIAFDIIPIVSHRCEQAFVSSLPMFRVVGCAVTSASSQASMTPQSCLESA